MKKIHIEFSNERLITPSGLVFVGQILGKSSRNPIRKAHPVPTRGLTDMHQLWHISAQKDTSSILNCGLGNSTARKKLLIS